MSNKTAIPLLEIRGLSKDFIQWGLRSRGSFRAVDNIDMEIQRGETRGLVGESGCGKTTLARCALRLLEPSHGSVYFDGQDLRMLSPAALRAKRREFQMVFQDSFGSFNPMMTVGEIVSEPFEIHGIGTRKEREFWVRELLDTVSLDESLIGRRPGELSGGQQQRVGIARALALKPRLLIADEPVSALDASVQAQILNLLAELQKRYGLTLILISHSLYAVNYLCAYVTVMYFGRIVEEASAARVFHQPRHPYSRMLLENLPAMGPLEKNKRHPAAKDISSSIVPRSGCLFHPRCPSALPRCRDQSPRLTESGAGEKVACFLYT